MNENKRDKIRESLRPYLQEDFDKLVKVITFSDQKEIEYNTIKETEKIKDELKKNPKQKKITLDTTECNKFYDNVDIKITMNKSGEVKFTDIENPIATRIPLVITEDDIITEVRGVNTRFVEKTVESFGDKYRTDKYRFWLGWKIFPVGSESIGALTRLGRVRGKEYKKGTLKPPDNVKTVGRKLPSMPKQPITNIEITSFKFKGGGNAQYEMTFLDDDIRGLTRLRQPSVFLDEDLKIISYEPLNNTLPYDEYINDKCKFLIGAKITQLIRVNKGGKLTRKKHYKKGASKTVKNHHKLSHTRKVSYTPYTHKKAPRRTRRNNP